METRICRKCEKEKPIGSFPLRYGRHAGKGLREHTCGMCKKRAHAVRHPESKQMETWLNRARKMCVTLSEYLYLRVCRSRAAQYRRSFLKIRKNQRTKCPVLAANPKIDYLINADYYKAKSRQWGRDNPDKQLAKKQRRRARLAGCPNTLTLDEWNDIKRRFGYQCVYCGKQGAKLTRDHVTPLSAGGDDSPSNVVPACWSCNSAKHVGPPPRPVQTLLFA